MLRSTMDKSNYSALQILRFSNNNGSSLTEIIFFTQLPVILNYFSVGCIIALQPAFIKENLNSVFVFEFCSIIFPLILFLTLASHLLFLFYICFIFVFLIIIFTRKDRSRSWSLFQTDIIIDEKPSCITVVRSTVNVLTVICILAADFTCFPHRFLKTKSYGYGLMDMGVGSFVIIYSLTDSLQKPRRSLRYSIYKILPFLVLGLGRYLSTSALNYHYEVTEYGTQWNFFMTLSAITLFNEVLLNFIKSIKGIFILTMFFLIIHEFCLTLGLQQWILSDASRHDFISGNREGVFSLLGYEVLYLSGMMIGNFLPKKNDSFRRYISILPRYLIGFMLCFTLTKLVELSFGVSRRTSNSGYIFWILSITFLTFVNTFICDIILRIFIYSEPNCASSVSLIMKAVNYNGLLFFLLGNILTGCINLSTKTLSLNSGHAVLIISAYMFICCTFNIFLYRKNIRLK